MHDRVVSEVVKEEITLDDHDRIATLQVNIRSAVEVSPSALDGYPVVSSNQRESDVRCRGLVFDPVDRVFDDEAGATRTRWGSLMDH